VTRRLLLRTLACGIASAVAPPIGAQIQGRIPVVGVLMLSFLANGLVVTGVERAWTTAAQGIVLVAAITISTFARRVAAR